MRIPRDEAGEGSGVPDMTPFIDCMFILIIFFLAAATFRQEEVDIQVNLPHADAKAALSAAPQVLVINVRQDGRYGVGARGLEFGALVSAVRESVAGNPAQKVLIRGDRAARHEHVAAAVRACKEAGVARANIGYDCTPLE